MARNKLWLRSRGIFRFDSCFTFWSAILGSDGLAVNVYVAAGAVKSAAPVVERDCRWNVVIPSISAVRTSARIALVEEHIRLENAHELEGVLRTFGDSARYDDEPWNEHFEGRNGVRAFYEQLMHAMPDLQIDVLHRHVSDDAILVEVTIRGTHLGAWRGLPATGRKIEFPLCGVYTFDADDRLAGEKIYYDRGTVLRQLGIFHEPQSLLGQLSILLTHPLTLARALARKIFGKRFSSSPRN